jgi:nitroreductase
MDVLTALNARRSVRAFGQEEIAPQALKDLVAAARLAPAAANLQPLEYLVVTDQDLRQQIFDCLKWAAYIAPQGDPAPQERPTAYVVILVRQEYLPPVGAAYDVGAAAHAILLLAVAQGLGGCWIKSVNYPRVAQLLGLPAGCSVDSVLALGVPAESPQVVDLKPEQTGKEVIRYWRDENKQHFVPKRALDAILHWQSYGAKPPEA